MNTTPERATATISDFWPTLNQDLRALRPLASAGLAELTDLLIDAAEGRAQVAQPSAEGEARTAAERAHDAQVQARRNAAAAAAVRAAACPTCFSTHAGEC